MKEIKLKEKIGIIFILCHTFIILSSIIFAVIGKLALEDMKSIVSVVLPVYTIYLVIFIKFFINNQNIIKDYGEEKNNTFVFLVFFFTILFNLIILFIIFKQILKPDSIENLTFYIGLCESAFGAYLTLIFKSLYEVEYKTD